MGRFLRRRLPEDPQELLLYVQDLLTPLLSFPRNITAAAATNRRNRLLAEAANVMQVDTHFLRLALVQPALWSITGIVLTERQRKNLEMALGVGAFREYLAAQILAGLENA
jgi:hypothetical protein